MSSLQKTLALSWADRFILGQALLALPVTAFAVSVLGVKRWQRALANVGKGRVRSSNPSSSVNASLRPRVTSVHATPETHPDEIRRARQIARLVRAASNHGLFAANCLQQSLVLWWLLRHNEIDSEVRFGAQKEEQEFKAHAWVECFGLALNEDSDLRQRYASFESAGA